MSHSTRLLVLIAVTASSLVVPKVLSGSAQSQPGCVPATIAGPYGIQGSGSNAGVAIAFVGVLLFDGQGKVTTATPVIANVGGTIDPIDVTGTYKTNADCTAKAFIQTAHHNPPRTTFHDIDMVVVNDGREALFIIGGVKNSESDAPRPGEVLSGVLKRV